MNEVCSYCAVRVIWFSYPNNSSQMFRNVIYRARVLPLVRCHFFSRSTNMSRYETTSYEITGLRQTNKGNVKFPFM